MAHIDAYVQVDLLADPTGIASWFNYYYYFSDIYGDWYGTGNYGEELDIVIQAYNNGYVDNIYCYIDGYIAADITELDSDIYTLDVQAQNGIKGWLGGDDTVIGSNYADRIVGMAGSDLLQGEGGNDIIYGNSGVDSIYGGSGNDKLIGGSNVDFLTGESGNDKLYGSSGNDKLWGNSGKDLLKGGSGRDRLYGGTNNDKLYGQSGRDYLTGQSGNDRLYGGSSNDKLYGGSGKDRLVGGSGSDRLSGGKGADKFVLQKGKGYDKITYFSTADKIVVKGYDDSKVRAVSKKGDVYLYAGKKDLLAIVLDGNGMNSLF